MFGALRSSRNELESKRSHGSNGTRSTSSTSLARRAIPAGLGFIGLDQVTGMVDAWGEDDRKLVRGLRFPRDAYSVTVTVVFHGWA